jgi:hypothetical protein
MNDMLVRIERYPQFGWLVRTRYDGVLMPLFRTRRQARRAAAEYRKKYHEAHQGRHQAPGAR